MRAAAGAEAYWVTPAFVRAVLQLPRRAALLRRSGGVGAATLQGFPSPSRA